MLSYLLVLLLSISNVGFKENKGALYKYNLICILRTLVYCMPEPAYQSVNDRGLCAPCMSIHSVLSVISTFRQFSVPFVFPLLVLMGLSTGNALAVSDPVCLLSNDSLRHIPT